MNYYRNSREIVKLVPPPFLVAGANSDIKPKKS